jgi:hypothetical protein
MAAAVFRAMTAPAQAIANQLEAASMLGSALLTLL